MKFRRGHQEQPDGGDAGDAAPPEAAIAPFVGAVYFALEDNLARCAQLTERREHGAGGEELRDEALAGARQIAYTVRMTWAMLGSGAVDPERISQDLLPYLAFEALARLEYALVGLAETSPEPEQLLGPEEIDGLIAQYAIETWVERCRTKSFVEGGAS